jgi:hypothetical protein
MNVRAFASLIASIAITVTVGAQKPSPQKQPAQKRESSSPSAVRVSGCEPSETDLRAATKAARAANPSDTKAFLRALDEAVGVKFGDAPTALGAYKVFSSEEISILVFPRYVTYRMVLEEQIRKMEPIENMPIPDGYTLEVSPSRIGAPDIIKVVVQSDGATIEPLENKLMPHTFETRMGAKFAAHAGSILYPCSGFHPKDAVIVTAIPDSGSNIVAKLFADELSRMK